MMGPSPPSGWEDVVKLIILAWVWSWDLRELQGRQSWTWRKRAEKELKAADEISACSLPAPPVSVVIKQPCYFSPCKELILSGSFFLDDGVKAVKSTTAVHLVGCFINYLAGSIKLDIVNTHILSQKQFWDPTICEAFWPLWRMLLSNLGIFFLFSRF